MTCAEWHPDDERLLSRCVERGGDPSLDQHLRWCRSCAQRLSALDRDLERWHLAVAACADEAFDARRLDAQRRSIQQRLGGAVPARVLPFPIPEHAGPHAPLARVAAAVLLVALTGAGVLRVLQMPEPPAAQAAFRRTPSRVASPARLALERSDDAVLEDIDLALVRPRTAVAELRALDEFTPHVRDLAAPRR